MTAQQRIDQHKSEDKDPVEEEEEEDDDDEVSRMSATLFATPLCTYHEYHDEGTLTERMRCLCCHCINSPMYIHV